LEKKRDLIPTPLKEWEEIHAQIIGGLSILVSFSIRGHKSRGLGWAKKHQQIPL
jgi:hypothetical protein